MRFIVRGIVTVVLMIRFGKKGCTVVRFWVGVDEIWVSMMRLGMKARTGETCWTGGKGIQVSVIFSDVKEQQITSFGTLSASFCSSGTQKKEYSDSVFRCKDAIDAVTFNEEAILFVSSALGFQKNERSDMGFVRGVTSNEEIFVGEAIWSNLTC